MHLFKTLQSHLAGEVTIDAKSRARCSEDRSPFQIMPAAVVFPKHTRDVRAVVRFVTAHKSKFPELSITARAAGTDVAGGPLNDSIILDFTRHFDHLIAIGDHKALAEPGVRYRDFERASLRKNLLLPSFPASRSICALGGMVANNAGGEKTLFYGKTDRHVTQLRVVLSDGHEYLIEPVSGAALKHKLALHSFEGDIYRGIFRLVTRHQRQLAASRPRVSKNSSGYALWDVWNPKTGVFDLTKLFVGSQGTLGLITQIGFRLVTPHRHSRMLALFVNDLALLPAVVRAVLNFKPESFEMYDKSVLKILIRFFPKFISLFGRNFFALLKDFLPEIGVVARSLRLPEYVLTAEFTGDSEHEVVARTRDAANALVAYGVQTHLTSSHAEALKYKIIRRESFSVLQQHSGKKEAVTFIDDLIVPPEQWPAFIPKLRAALDAYPELTYTMFGHIGDGNLHVVPLLDVRDPKTREIIADLTRTVNNLVIEFHGSITAEHNDGLVRSPFLTQMFGRSSYDLFKKTKHLFDPLNIFNPKKKIGADFDYALDHLKHTL